MIELNELIISISVALTIPFLCYCCEIMYVWWPSVRETFKKEEPLTAAGQLARGIWLGFATNFIDNMYWMSAWFLTLLQHPVGVTMMLGGALFNIFFRQMGGILAAREHVIAASKLHDKLGAMRMHKYYWAAGLVVFIGLIASRFI